MLKWIKENKTDAFGIFFLFILPTVVFIINDLVDGWAWGMETLVFLVKIFSLPFCLLVPGLFCSAVYKTITEKKEAQLLGKEIADDPSKIVVFIFMGFVAVVSLYGFLILLFDEILGFNWF